MARRETNRVAETSGEKDGRQPGLLSSDPPALAPRSSLRTYNQRSAELPGNEATYAQLLQATGILSLHSLRVSTPALVRAGRLVRTKYGRFALPSARAGKNLWRSIRGEVLTVLTGMPGNKAPVSELTRIINRARGAGSSVSSAISRLVHEGRVKRLNREMVALTEAAIGQKSWEPQGQHRAIQKVVDEILRQNRRVATAEPSASKNGVNYVVRKLVRENKLRRVWPGVYASPHTGQKSWSPARDAILDAFRGRDRVARAKLIEITGRKGPAIAAAIHDLVREGKLKRVQRGVYTVVKAA